MVKYKNISGCNVIVIVNGKLVVIGNNGVIEGRTIVAHPGLELVQEIKLKQTAKKIDKKRNLNNASEANSKGLRE